MSESPALYRVATGRGCSVNQALYRGRVPPWGPTLYPFTYCFLHRGYPFCIITEGYISHIPQSTSLLTAVRKCTVLNMSKSQKKERSSTIPSHKMNLLALLSLCTDRNRADFPNPFHILQLLKFLLFYIPEYPVPTSGGAFPYRPL